MNRNMLKVPSMLFLSLALATACSKGPDKDPEKKENKGSVDVGAVLKEARTAKEQIDSFDTSGPPYNDVAGVRGGAYVALSRVWNLAVDDSLLAASGGDVKAKLGEAASTIKGYSKKTWESTADEELVEARKVADQVVNALAEAEKAHTS